MEQTSVPYKFKIFTHKKKGTRAITYKLPHEGNVKLWDGEILANSFVSDKGEKIYYWIKYYAIPKPAIAAFGFNTSTKNQIKKIIPKIKKESGPILVLVEIDKGGEKSIRVDLSPPDIKKRFIKSLKKK